MQTLGFGHSARRIVGQIRRHFQAHKTAGAVFGTVFGQTYITGCLNIGNRQGFVTLLGTEVLLFQRRHFIGIQCITGKGFLKNGRIRGNPAHAFLQHARQLARLHQRA